MTDPSDAKYAWDEQGILRRFFNDQLPQIVVPMGFFLECLIMEWHIRQDGFHRSNKEVADRILPEYFWPGLFTDIKNYRKNCNHCQAVQLRRGRSVATLVS